MSQHCFDSGTCLGQSGGFSIFHLLHFLMPDEKEINLISSCNHLVCVLVTEGMGGLAGRREGREKLQSQAFVLSLLCAIQN